MINAWIRSILFNICFWAWSIVVCISIIPFIYASKKTTLRISHIFNNGVYFIEKYVLGLDYEVRGLENLPKEGPYLIAAKHQSAYETMKLHRLFGDPSIILKQELLSIPVWGKFLGKLDIIAIDRSKGETAMSSIVNGAMRMKDQGRPIVIFPQGTRVRVDVSSADKPYKGGIIKMYNATSLPIIPMALNSGLFWPRNSFLKRPGKVIFEFLPAIEPGLEEKKVMKALEERLEEASIRLMDEAKEHYPLLQSIKTQALLS
jgi:1-acyl-sn-glycerol-3-phosphate acyltransferase